MKIRRRYLSGFILLLLLLLTLSSSLVKTYGFEDSDRFEYNRAGLIGYLVRQNLRSNHFSNKHFDKGLSNAIMTVYLKSLDGQKRFLLKSDVEKIRSYTYEISDEMNTGKLELPDVATELFNKRSAQVRQMVSDILSGDFEFNARESLETDAEKLDYCADENELKERWRKILKYEVLGHYLTMLEDQAGVAAAESKAGAKEESKPEANKKAFEKTEAVKEENRETAKTPEKSQDTKPDNETILKSARDKVAKNYETFFSRMLQEKERERFDRFFGAVARSFDPHTEYMPPSNKEDFDISMRGTLEGIGATLREDDNRIKVVSLVPGGPAFLQGQLHAEDIILKVAEGANEPVDITNMSVGEAVRLIRGKKGTEVRLTVRKPDGSYLVISIIRDIVQIEDTFAKGTTIKDEKSSKNFGYIKIPTFYRDFEASRHGGGRNSTDDVRKELHKFESENINGLVIDLRNNGGGALTDAVKIAGLFIRTGPVVQVKNNDGRVSVLADEEPGIQYSGPLVILVNKFSASASEILAGAMQDYGRAVIIGGDHTHGKGTVQSIMDLNDMSSTFGNADKYKPLGALKMTIQKFYRISGASTQYRGVIPDIQLPDRMKGVKSGEEFLENALPWDTIGPARYSRWANPGNDIRELKDRSMVRVLSSQDFKDIETHSNRIIDQRKKTLFSLNIDEARKERAENAEGDKGRKSPHGNLKGLKKPSGEVMTEQEKKDFWLKELNEDIYLQEAFAVLSDMLSLRHPVSMN